MLREGVSVVKAVLCAGAVLALLLHVTAKPRSQRAPSAPPVLAEPHPTTVSAGSVRVLVLDVTDPWEPQPVDLQRPAWRPPPAPAVLASEDYAHALYAYGQYDRVLPDGSPAYSLADYRPFMAMVANHAYLPTGAAGLRILQLGAAGELLRDRTYATPGAAKALLVRDSRAYVAVVLPWGYVDDDA